MNRVSIALFQAGCDTLWTPHLNTVQLQQLRSEGLLHDKLRYCYRLRMVQAYKVRRGRISLPLFKSTASWVKSLL